MKNVQTIIVPIASIILTGVLASVIFFVSAEQPAVMVTHAVTGEIGDQLRFSGKVRPAKTLHVGFERAGTISHVYVQAGVSMDGVIDCYYRDTVDWLG
ncbi:MAG: hypothetical protein ACSLEX_04055 [Minisyncoccota bacterium]